MSNRAKSFEITRFFAVVSLMAGLFSGPVGCKRQCVNPEHEDLETCVSYGNWDQEGVSLDATFTDSGDVDGSMAGDAGLTGDGAVVGPQCASHLDCVDKGLSACRNGVCSPCGASSDCGHLPGLTTCDVAAGVCRECTVGTESQDCGLRSCNPATFECTHTLRQSRRVCESCEADSECSDADARCVELSYQGAPRGGYCLQQKPAGGCERPFGEVLTSRRSLSNTVPGDFCGIPESATTCEAVRDMVDKKSCQSNSECGIGGSDSQCHYGKVCYARCETGDHCPGSIQFCDQGTCRDMVF